ncbi:MAG TPA: c-type cytochrome, partial [Stenotrophobium sp.]|nr:c-type cytochrome [Stenotrophobium sp.]
AAPPAAAPAAAAEPAAPAATTASPASPATTASAAGGGDLVLGEKVFGTTCVTCHGAGVLGAPKVGDKTAWGPRVAQGKDTLYTHALNGFKMMPARGGNAALKDDEVKAAIDYMVSKAG